MILANVLRLDRGEVPTLTGADTFTGVAARVHTEGDGLVYLDENGEQTIEYRDLAETMVIARQLDAGLPVRLGHLGPVVGVTTSARVDSGNVIVSMRIDSAQARLAIMSGVRELSLGYRCRSDSNGYQRQVVSDHLAIVEVARCGSTCSIKVDSADRMDCGCGCTTSKGITSSVQDAAYWRDRSDAVDVDRLKTAGVRIPSGYSAAWLRAAVAALNARAKFHADVAEAARVLDGTATSKISTDARAAYIERTRNASLPKEPSK